MFITWALHQPVSAPFSPPLRTEFVVSLKRSRARSWQVVAQNEEAAKAVVLAQEPRLSFDDLAVEVYP